MSAPKHYLLAALAGSTLLIPVVALALAGLVSVPTLDTMPTTTPGETEYTLESLANEAADKHGVPRDIFAALINRESAWNPDAAGGAGEIGLTQVMPDTGASYCGMDATKLRNPDCNLQCGASYLAAQFERFGDWRLALAAYNAGPGRVIDAGGMPAITSTQDYVQAICGASNCGGAA